MQLNFEVKNNKGKRRQKSTIQKKKQYAYPQYNILFFSPKAKDIKVMIYK